MKLPPWTFLVVAVAGWVRRHQDAAIEYLREENRVLREQLGSSRLRFTDVQRRRLAVRARELSRRLLGGVATLVSPETLRQRCGRKGPRGGGRRMSVNRE